MATKSAKTLDEAAAVLEKIAAMPAPYNAMGKAIHNIILASSPALKPKVWYGMPGYAGAGPVLCFFRVDGELMTFGLTEKARHAVEDGAGDRLMASAWFFRELDDATGKRIGEIVRRAVG